MTGRDLVERATLRAALRARGEPLTAPEANDALASLNEMLTSLENEGIRLGIGDQTLSGTIPLPANHQRALILLLAVELLDEVRRDPPILLATKADRAKRQLMNEYIIAPEAKLDPALTDFTANRSGYDITQG